MQHCGCVPQPEEGSIRTQAIERALRGETDVIEATNYLGQQTMRRSPGRIARA